MSARTDKKTFRRPRLLLAYADSTHAASTARFFRRHGWEVHLAASGSEAYRLISEMLPRVVVVDSELQDESGWLTCAKINLQNPEQTMMLLTPDRQDHLRDRARSIGVSELVSRLDGVDGLADKILGSHFAEAV